MQHFSLSNIDLKVFGIMVYEVLKAYMVIFLGQHDITRWPGEASDLACNWG